MQPSVFLPTVIVPWQLVASVFGIGAVLVIMLTVAIALLTKDSHPRPRHRAHVQSPSTTAEVSAKEHVLV
jgi:hypothetical protein